MVRVELEDDEEMAPKLEGNEVVCMYVLQPMLVISSLKLGGYQCRQERERGILFQMEGSNRVEPLNKHEYKLKIVTL